MEDTLESTHCKALPSPTVRYGKNYSEEGESDRYIKSMTWSQLLAEFSALKKRVDVLEKRKYK